MSLIQITNNCCRLAGKTVKKSLHRVVFSAPMRPKMKVQATPPPITYAIAMNKKNHFCQLHLVRKYETQSALTRNTIKERVLLVLNSYDRIDSTKLGINSHFLRDLGLNSLDRVELLMHLEDEFGFEIPDADGERLLSASDVIKYVAARKRVPE